MNPDGGGTGAVTGAVTDAATGAATDAVTGALSNFRPARVGEPRALEIPPVPAEPPGTATERPGREIDVGADEDEGETVPPRLPSPPSSPPSSLAPSSSPALPSAPLSSPALSSSPPSSSAPALPSSPALPLSPSLPPSPRISALSDDAPAPSLPLQLNALQALCRQVFGLRLALIVLGAPLALSRAEGGLGSILVGSAVVFGLMGSYAMLRDWERLGPLVLRHRWLMAVDLTFGAVLLLTASPDSPLGYAAVCTPLLTGLLYGWRGAGVYTALQILVLAAVYTAWHQRLSTPDDPTTPASTLLISGFCVLAGIVGVTLRNLMFRFGTATQALAEAHSRLAVTEAVEAERARLAREMHDSVAKTLQGVALSADALATSADRMDPLTVRHQAGLVARSARRAAAESRELLGDLRRRTDYGSHGSAGVDVGAELASRAADFTTRTGIACSLTLVGEAGPSQLPLLPHAVARNLLTVATEALDNAHRHAEASRVALELGVTDGRLRLNILDNGRGLPPGTHLEELRRAGHFGLVGMVERAAAIGARIRIGKGHSAKGTEVRVDYPLRQA